MIYETVGVDKEKCECDALSDGSSRERGQINAERVSR